MSVALPPLQLPEFELPFPRAINPACDAIVRHTADWAKATGLVMGDGRLRKLESDGIIDAGSRLVPTAPLEQACLVSDWTLFLIVLDDEFDGRELGSHPELSETVIDPILAGSGGGIGRALTDLRRRFGRVAPTPEWLQRFSYHANEHMRSKVTEAVHRASGDRLDVSGYVALRRITGAPYTYADLAEMAVGASVPDGVRHSRLWHELLLAFADVFLAIQDICSCATEVAAGDDLNLVVAIQRAERCSLQEAVEWASGWLDERARCFVDDADGVLALCQGNGGAADVAQCIDAFDALLGGHLAWNSEDNPRYAS